MFFKASPVSMAVLVIKLINRSIMPAIFPEIIANLLMDAQPKRCSATCFEFILWCYWLWWINMLVLTIISLLRYCAYCLLHNHLEQITKLWQSFKIVAMVYFFFVLCALITHWHRFNLHITDASYIVNVDQKSASQHQSIQVLSKVVPKTY